VAADPAADPAVNPPNTAFLYRPNIGSVLGSTGCSTYGPLGFVQGSSSNKCARYETFQYQANPENSQLGSRLVFNWVGGFYSCGSGKDVSAIYYFYPAALSQRAILPGKAYGLYLLTTTPLLLGLLQSRSRRRSHRLLCD